MTVVKSMTEQAEYKSLEIQEKLDDMGYDLVTARHTIEYTGEGENLPKDQFVVIKFSKSGELGEYEISHHTGYEYMGSAHNMGVSIEHKSGNDPLNLKNPDTTQKFNFRK